MENHSQYRESGASTATTPIRPGTPESRNNNNPFGDDVSPAPHESILLPIQLEAGIILRFLVWRTRRTRALQIFPFETSKESVGITG
jgi:hypothetical protein